MSPVFAETPTDAAPRLRRPFELRTFASPRRRRLLTAILGFLGLGVVAVVHAFVLALALLAGQTDPAWAEGLLHGSGVLSVDVLVLWTLLLLVWSVVGRFWWTVAGTSAVVALLAVVNHQKLELRREPLYPSDLDFVSEAGFVFSMVPAWVVVATLVGLVAIVALVGVGGEWLTGRRRHGRPRGRDLLEVAVVRVLVLVTTGVLVAQMTQFNEPGNPWRRLYESQGAAWRLWHQEGNYLANGFVGGFLYNMPVDAMERPEGYSREAMAGVVERATGIADEVNATREGSLADTNVVVVLSESFSDPTALEGFELERDPMPDTRALMARTAAGAMLSSGFGGGTANIEFEVLTGQSLSLMRPQMVAPYQMLVADFARYPSLVGALASEGHEAVAIHPFTTDMYKRNDVYDTFGFTEFVDQDTLRSPTRTDANAFIDDAAAYDEVVARIEETDEPLVLNLVTMQNHAPYAGRYTDPIAVDGVEGHLAEDISQFARGIEHTDEALEPFLEGLEETGEDTVVLFYGDHLPSLYGEELSERNGLLAMRSTPYFLWSTGGTRPEPLADVSPAFLLPALYAYADAPAPPYVALLERFHDEVGSLLYGDVVDADGEVVDREDLDPEQRRLLDDLTLVQYDVTVGGQYALDELWPGATGP